MDFDSTEQINDLARLPPVQPRTSTKWNMWSAPLRAIPAAIAEMGAAAGESLKAYGQVMGATGTDAAGGMFSTQSARERAESDSARRELLTTGPVGANAGSRRAREFAEYMGPDPATAGAAEQVVFGLFKGVAKAGAYGLTIGPLAPVAFGVDEGMSQTDRLQREGVDTKTAIRSGAVAGVVNAVGLTVPVAGSTLARTAGLAALSGPASFIAQQSVTRDILQSADYAGIAEQYDPLDPLGLALSALPFGFGAWAMRSRLRRTGQGADVQRQSEPLRGPDQGGAGQQAARDQPQPAAAQAVPRAVGEGAGQLAADAAVQTRNSVPDFSAAVPHVEVTRDHVDAAMVHNLTMVTDHAASSPEVRFQAELWRAAVTETPDFRDWFHQSKIVDDDGAPMIVYRTAASEWDAVGPMAVRAAVDDAGDGLYLTRNGMEARSAGAEPDAVYVSMKNPYAWPEDDAPPSRANGVNRAELEAQGHDGIVYRNGEQIVAFRPEQVRPALGVAGTPAKEAATPIHAIAPAAAATQTRVQKVAAAWHRWTASGSTSTGAEDPFVRAVRQRADEVVAEAPDLVVGTSDDGKPITAKELLAKIRQESAEGTETELGSNDAALFDVAIRCALSHGE